MSECSHNCSSCSKNCKDRAEIQKDAPNAQSRIKKVVAVMSGKGGVGKSLVTSAMAVAMQKRGFQTAVLDADITGPSIPKAFGVKERLFGTAAGIMPADTKTGVKIVSLNLLLEDESAPVLWRGPVITGTVRQFFSQVCWGDVDYMFIDMPPGTGDVPLTVFQSLPVNAAIIVTTPQELVGMIVEKAVKMADMMKVPVLALVENMAYFKCPDCQKEYEIFGKSHLAETAKKYGIKTTARLPLSPRTAALCDAGDVESSDVAAFDALADALEKL